MDGIAAGWADCAVCRKKRMSEQAQIKPVQPSAGGSQPGQPNHAGRREESRREEGARARVTKSVEHGVSSEQN